MSEVSNNSFDAEKTMGDPDESLPPDWPTVTLLLLNWNGRDVLELCLPSLVELDYPSYRILMIDNASSDGSVEYVRERYPQVNIIVNDENLGFSRAMNVGLRQADSEVVVLLNNDVTARPDWLKELVRPLVADETIGITGCKLLFPDGKTLQHCGARLEYPLAYSHHYFYKETDAGQADQVRDVDYVTGAAMAIARRVVDAIGILDERFSPIYFEETDYCYRAKAAGFRIVYVPDSVAIHHESLTMRRASRFHVRCFHMNRLRFVLKHYTARQFMDDFVPAEVERLSEPSSADQLDVVRRVFLETFLRLPDLLHERDEADLLDQFQAAFAQLRQVALSQRPEIHVPSDSKLRAELTDRQSIREFEFTSDKPVIGGLIASFRNAWSAIATKWALRSLIQQQASFNEIVARVLDEHDAEGEARAAEASLLASELLSMERDLGQRLAEVNHRLDKLNERLGRLEQVFSQERANPEDDQGHIREESS